MVDKKPSVNLEPIGAPPMPRPPDLLPHALQEGVSTIGMLTWLRGTNARDAIDHRIGSSHSFRSVRLPAAAVR